MKKLLLVLTLFASTSSFAESRRVTLEIDDEVQYHLCEVVTRTSVWDTTVYIRGTDYFGTEVLSYIDNPSGTNSGIAKAKRYGFKILRDLQKKGVCLEVKFFWESDPY